MKPTGLFQMDGLDTQKTIDGELYGLWNTKKTKREAQKEANKIRKRFAPVRVRVLKFSKGYAIYRRNGRKG